MNYSPIQVLKPSSPALKTFLSLNDSEELVFFHKFLISHFRIPYQFQTLYSRTINITQISRNFPLFPYGSHDEIKELYLLQFEDNYHHTPSEQRILSLAIRCQQAFEILINPKSVLDKCAATDEIIQNLYFLAKRLKDSKIQQNAVLNHIIKPLYRHNLNLYMTAMRYFPTSSDYIFFQKFIEGLSTFELYKFLIYFLVPCIRTKESVSRIAKLFKCPILPQTDLSQMKLHLKIILNSQYASRDRESLEKGTLNTFLVLIKDPGPLDEDDPEPFHASELKTEIQINSFFTNFDSELMSEFLAFVAAPLFCTPWRLKKATSLLLFLTRETPSEKVSTINSCKILLQKTLLNPLYRSAYGKLYPKILKLLIGTPNTAQDKCNRPKIIHTPVKNLDKRKDVGRKLIYGGHIFKPVARAANECFGCTKKSFREQYPAREFRWAHGFYKKRPITEEYRQNCLAIISNAMKYFTIEGERRPEEIFISLVARNII